MEEQKENLEITHHPKEGSSWKWIAILAVAVLALTQIYAIGKNAQKKSSADSNQNNEAVNSENEVLRTEGVELPIKWQDLGGKLVETGVIDASKFESLYAGRGGLTPEEKELLSGLVSGKIIMTERNSAFWLNLLWAFGLANKNPILEKGPMQDTQYGGAENFASTGGWTLARGNPMNHYSKHEFIKLTPDQQLLAEEVSKGIYRPCCGNSTYFPDCNHGMAMLGLLELMVANGATEKEMYQVALQVNSYWFPDTYLTIDKYLKMKDMSLATADPKEILGINYSSAYGYANILKQTQPVERKSEGGCGV